MHIPRFLSFQSFLPITPPSAHESGTTTLSRERQAFATEPDRAFTPCMLFNDRIPDYLCRIRRSELDNRGDFTCADCPHDRIS